MSQLLRNDVLKPGLNEPKKPVLKPEGRVSLCFHLHDAALYVNMIY